MLALWQYINEEESIEINFCLLPAIKSSYFLSYIWSIASGHWISLSEFAIKNLVEC